MPAFDHLPPASFDGIEFPVRRVEVTGALRHHVHEYPHSPGGEQEPLGRRLYSIRMTALFHATFKRYPGLWPQRLDALRGRFEIEKRAELVIPTIGAIQARAVQWRTVMEAKVQSGEDAEIEFLEVQTSPFLISALAKALPGDVGAAHDAFEEEAAKMPYRPDIFDSIRDAANAILAFRDQAELYGMWLESKLLGLAALCAEADGALDILQDPQWYRVLDALHELWAQANELARNVTGKRSEPRFYVVPSVMAVGQVSTAIYGDATHAVELLQLNDFDDAFAIKAGTRVRYMPEAA